MSARLKRIGRFQYCVGNSVPEADILPLLEYLHRKFMHLLGSDLPHDYNTRVPVIGPCRSAGK